MTASSVDYSLLLSNSYCSPCCHRAIQTDLTINKLTELESKSALDLEMRDNKIEDLQRANEELKRQLQGLQKGIEKQKEQLSKCNDVTKQLLVEKVLPHILLTFGDYWSLLRCFI
ncbi:TLK2 [Cordylochernes scorpioides]|uniref:TLK2 n=1 Tax=Cordylochernes scorpioides TaxID=51811 RepID=A0ABY6KJG8_9ARAC|nr:TLK2 [Cordylochernes scorpioides]